MFYRPPWTMFIRKPCLYSLCSSDVTGCAVHGVQSLPVAKLLKMLIVGIGIVAC